ncbi:hypothetical protein HYV11_01010 [Candidatus Dependentiae bacterium]|nr:hypothetical protein [Candidatus Dependentiae bacterium]
MNNALVFKLNNQKSLCLISDGLSMKEVYTCYHLEMYWCVDEKKLLIGQDSSGDIAHQFERLLPLALEQKLMLDSSIQKNLGFYLNEIFADRKSFLNLVYKYASEGKYTYWIGMNYLMASTCAPHNPVVVTWMYNDANGDIILEVTEMFSWSEQEIASPEEMDRYFAFLKNYKPILKQVISQKVAEQWLRKAKKWYKIFYDNEQKECGR